MAERSLVGHTLGVYELVRLIGEGAGGAVYEARAAQDGPAGPAGARVALKVIHPELVSDARLFRRFEREAELGIRIRNEHIVPSYECAAAEIDGATWHYLAMELVRGETLRHTLAELRIVPEALLYQIADQVLDALVAIHAEGMIHRDIKPENVLITPDHRILVMDLGVARLQQEGRDLTQAGEFVGSLVYAAPEQFTDQDAVGPAADIYALGVLLYELCTGINPFDAASLRALIRQKVKGLWRRPKSHNRALDPFLDEVVRTCMNLDPDARFASASQLRDVLRDGAASAWWRERIEDGAYAAASAALASIATRRRAPLLGREAELQDLHASYDSVCSGASGMVLLSGAVGVGKTRLVHDFLEDLVAPDGPWVRVVRGPDEGIGAAEAAELADLAAKRPVVLFVDDAHLADEQTVARIRQLQVDLAYGSLLTILAWRTEDLAVGSATLKIVAEGTNRPGIRSLPLAPLRLADARSLVESLVRVPRTVRALSGPLVRTCAGNPHFLLEAVAHLQATGALGAEEDGWTPARPIREVDLPSSLRGLLERKLDQLEPDLRALLEAVAVHGVELDAALLAAITGSRRIKLLKQLGRLERRHHLLRSGEQGGVRIADAALRRVVYERIAPAERRALHSRFGDALMAPEDGRTDGRAYACVGHLVASGRVDEADPMIASATAYARSSVHPSEGILYLERLAAELGPSDPASRFEIFMTLAELHRLSASVGEHRQALAQAFDAAEQSDESGLRARGVAARARAAWAAGRDAEAETQAAVGLELARRAADEACRARCLETLGAVSFRRGALEAAAGSWQQALDIWRARGDRRAEARAMLRLAQVAPQHADSAPALETNRRALGMLRDAGDVLGEAAALRAVGVALLQGNRHEEALEVFSEALALAREHGDQPGEAEVLASQARIHTLLGQWEDAKSAYAHALDIFQALEDPGGEARVLDGLGMAMATFGEPGEALAQLERAREVAQRAGERALLGRICRHLGTLRHETASRDSAWASFEEALNHAQGHARSLVLADMGSAAERERDPARAVDLLARSLEAAERDEDRLLTRCRLARAHMAAGDWAEARAEAEHAEALIERGAEPGPQHGPEVLFSLGSVLVTEARGRDYLERASRLVNERMRSIKSIVSRDRYLTMRWPNPEIFDAMRRLDASDPSNPGG